MQSDEDFNAEIEAHIALETDRLIAQGLSPSDARDAAIRTFGNVAVARERFYESRRLLWFDHLTQDARYALRSFARTPGFTLVAVLTLALGIGANTAIFSVINAVLLRPLPYPDADRLVRILDNSPQPQPIANVAPPGPRISVAELVAIRSEARTLSDAGMYLLTGGTLTARGESRRLNGIRMSGGMFAALAVPPLHGRTFDARDETPGADGVMILSHALWRRDFAGDPRVIGQSLTLDTRDYTVVGVMPAGFLFPDAFAEFWVPHVLPTGRAALVQRTSPTARLEDGVSAEAAAREVSAILQRSRQEGRADASSSPQVQVVRMQDQLVAPVKPALLVLAGAVGFVLLIACVNVANLLLARTIARQREIAVRRAIGATSGRLARQMLTESVLLALAGGIAATLLAVGGIWLLRLLGSSLPRRDLGAGVGLPRLDEVAVDAPMFLFALAGSVITGLLFGIVPAVRQARAHPSDALRQATASARSGFNLWRSHRVQGLLVVAEIAMALMLFVGGGLLIRSFHNLSNVDPGYQSANVLTFRVAAPGGRAAAARLGTLAEDLVARLQSVPGVRAAGYSEHVPMVQSRTGMPLRTSPDMPIVPPPGAPPRQGADTHFVSRDFLSVLGMRLAAGRLFGAQDGAGQPQVILINQALARTGLLGDDPIGRQIYAIGKAPWQVVGIVEDVRQYGLDQMPVPQVFFDMRQLPAIPGGVFAAVEYFVVRTDGDPMAIVPHVRDLVKQLDPAAAVESVATLDELVANSVARPRLYAVLLGLFAAVAVALAVVGIYGVMAYVVVQRTREIGIRMALGARRAEVMGLVLSQSVLLTGIGIVVGLAGAAALSRYLERLLFGLTPLDPMTFFMAAALFAAVATSAALVPARRATKVDPLLALRCE